MQEIEVTKQVLISFIFLNSLHQVGVKTVKIKLLRYPRTLLKTRLCNYKVLLVGSALDCSLYRWRLFVYFTFH